MSGTATKRMLAAYFQEAAPTGYFSGKFRSPPQNFHDTEKVEIDIVRSEEDVSIVISNISAGYRHSAADIYTNKEFTPPIHKEAVVINANTLLQRVPGSDPFADDDFVRRLNTRVMMSLPKAERLIRRAIELQASQVLQTGVIDMKDENGNTLFTIDFKPKASHLPQVTVSWSAAGATPLQDLGGLCDVIREDGLAIADEATFGADAWANFIKNSTVLALLDNRRMTLGGINPSPARDGAKFMGTIIIGDCTLNMFIYSGRYTDPQSGASTRFMDTNKVVVRDSQGRMDATFGGIPSIVPPDPRILPFLPARISNAQNGMDMVIKGWLDQTGENLSVGVAARPLMIPTAIDTFGCLNTVAP